MNDLLKNYLLNKINTISTNEVYRECWSLQTRHAVIDELHFILNTFCDDN